MVSPLKLSSSLWFPQEHRENAMWHLLPCASAASLCVEGDSLLMGRGSHWERSLGLPSSLDGYRQHVWSWFMSPVRIVVSCCGESEIEEDAGVV